MLVLQLPATSRNTAPQTTNQKVAGSSPAERALKSLHYVENREGEPLSPAGPSNDGATPSPTPWRDRDFLFSSKGLKNYTLDRHPNNTHHRRLELSVFDKVSTTELTFGLVVVN